MLIQFSFDLSHSSANQSVGEISRLGFHQASPRTEDVKNALSEIGIVGFSISTVQGRGRGAGVLIHGRTGDYIIDMSPRTLLTIVLSEHNVDTTVKAIKNGAFTGEKGDGVIFISPVDEVIRISTNETGKDALQYQGDIDSKVANGKK